jgi:hypothetical protein
MGVEGGGEALAVDLFDEAAEADGESLLGGILRAEGPDGLASVVEAFADLGFGFFEVRGGGAGEVLAEEFTEDFELDGDADVALGEGVVDFAGDAVALGHDGAELALDEENAAADDEEHEGCGGEDEKGDEPGGLIEVREELELERGFGGRAGFAVEAGANAEAVGARRDVGVIRGATGAGVGPGVVEALKHVLVAELLRGGEAEAGVVEFEAEVTGGDADGGT